MAWFNNSERGSNPEAAKAVKQEQIADTYGKALGELGLLRMRYEDQGMGKSEIVSRLTKQRNLVEQIEREIESGEANF
jgi:hypothetical protein